MMMRHIRFALGKAGRFLIFKMLYPACYFVFSRKPADGRKIIFCEMRFPELTDNFRLIYEQMRQTDNCVIHIHYLKNMDSGKGAYIRRSLRFICDMADAGCVFLNDGCRIIGCFHVRKETKVIQTWHACGAFKKFGMSTGDKRFGETKEELEKYPNYGNLDLVTVSSREVVWAYEEAMNLPKEKNVVQPLGVSRTDIFFDDNAILRAREKVKQVFPACVGRTIILYAPTFRGAVDVARSPDFLDIEKMQEKLSDKYVLLVQHHPFVKNRPKMDEKMSSFVMDMTGKMTIEELLCVSDICISDYSSLIFEFSLFERPMFFLAPDLDDYFDWRGFYYDYYEMTPGPVVKTTDALITEILRTERQFDHSQIAAFREKFMGACDGHSTDRIVKFALEDKNVNKNIHNYSGI